jgi:hypothetical protein
LPKLAPPGVLKQNVQTNQNPIGRPLAGGHLGFIQIPITFEPLDRFFQNLVTNFGPPRAITQNVQTYQNPIWRP